MPEIAFLMGKSSSGKDHIFKAVVEDESLCLNTITMYTTRPMRAGEAILWMIRQLVSLKTVIRLLR